MANNNNLGKVISIKLNEIITMQVSHTKSPNKWGQGEEIVMIITVVANVYVAFTIFNLRFRGHCEV